MAIKKNKNLRVNSPLYRHLTAVTHRDLAIGDLLYRPLVATLNCPEVAHQCTLLSTPYIDNPLDVEYYNLTLI